jgi:release factor glutamine methyltransferase
LKEKQNVGSLLADAARRLAAAGASSPRLDAELLLGKVSGWSRVEVLAHPEWRVDNAVENAFHTLVNRRAASEPIAYVLGEREFYGRSFKVDRRALIPRPETELLVDIGIAAVARWRSRGVEPTVVDVGTGSGAVAVSVVTEASARVVATDISFDALELARENAFHHHASVVFLQTDLVSGLRGPLHVVLANLPYVPTSRLLPLDVVAYEPAVAIFGGARGTEPIERLLREARAFLAPGAEMAVELDEEEQAEPMAQLAHQLYPSADVSVCQDAGGYDRVVRLVLPNPTA